MAGSRNMHRVVGPRCRNLPDQRGHGASDEKGSKRQEDPRQGFMPLDTRDHVDGRCEQGGQYDPTQRLAQPVQHGPAARQYDQDQKDRKGGRCGPCTASHEKRGSHHAADPEQTDQYHDSLRMTYVEGVVGDDFHRAVCRSRGQKRDLDPGDPLRSSGSRQCGPLALDDSHV
jgi:hypothetical protein